MYLIGLTGPSGAGKGLFSTVLREYGFAVIDADKVYHSLLVPPSPCLDALCAEFGKEILSTDGTLNRRALSNIVFSPTDPIEKQRRIDRLNHITHGFVLRRTDELLEEYAACGVTAVVFDAPALYEAGADKRCNLLVTVIASPDVRLRRIMVRDQLSHEDALRRIRAQHTDDFYTERAHFVLTNNGTSEEFIASVRQFYLSELLPRLSST